MVKKLQPGDRFNRFQAKKKARKAQKDPETAEINKQIVKIATDVRRLRKVAINGLV